MINLASAQATGLAGSRKVTGMDNGRPEPDPPGRGLPLAGILVVSVEQAVAAPYATRQLADLGARVIKAERPGPGDFARGYDQTVHGQSSYFVWLNGRNQKAWSEAILTALGAPLTSGTPPSPTPGARPRASRRARQARARLARPAWRSARTNRPIAVTLSSGGSAGSLLRPRRPG
jgi:CoA-transferase family III